MAIACVTGASSGIGRECAKQLSGMGYNLILISRHARELKKLASTLKTKCKVISCDLSDTESSVKLAKKLRHYNISILVNNAGFGEIGDFADTKLKNDLNMIDLNVKSVHILTKAILPQMVKRDDGYILNVSSIAGLMPGGPYMSTYYATKAYVTSLTCAVNHELREAGSNVSVSALCPGPVDTNFNKRANVEFSLKGITPEFCASYGLYHMFRKKLIIIPTMELKLSALFIRFLPRKAVLAFLSHQQKKKKTVK